MHFHEAARLMGVKKEMFFVVNADVMCTASP